MVSKLVFAFVIILVPTTIIFCQVTLPSGGAVEVLRKEDFAVDMLCWLSGILSGVIVYLYMENKKLKDNTIKDLKEKLMRYENK